MSEIDRVQRLPVIDLSEIVTVPGVGLKRLADVTPNELKLVIAHRQRLVERAVDHHKEMIRRLNMTPEA